MKNQTRHPKFKNSEKGLVVTEFLFAIAIAFGLTMVTFALTFTLSTIEIAQYITFSASRAHSAANFSVDAQKREAVAKYRNLVSNPVFAPLFQNGWFEISRPEDLEIRSGSGDNFASRYNPNGPAMQGVRMNFTARLLEMRVPLIGSITPDGDGFRTALNAVLLREPSLQECQAFMQQRLEATWNLSGGFARFRNQRGTAPWEDNAC